MDLLGRQSSHYTRLVRMFALELGVPLTLAPIRDLMDRDPAAYGGNPALRLPVLRKGTEVVYGSLNICRVLARAAGREREVFWPEDASSALEMNAHELLAQAMAGQVEVVMHEFVARRPPDAPSIKRREGLLACLAWLDAHLEQVLPAVRRKPMSWFEPALFALLAHLPFRNPLDVSALVRLAAFSEQFGQRPSAQATPYRFDP